jgi:hypothetical protein
VVILLLVIPGRSGLLGRQRGVCLLALTGVYVILTITLNAP